MMLKPIFIRDDKALRKIHPEEVLCLSTEKNYTRIFLTDDTYYMVRSTLTSALKKLPSDIFIKIHRSYVASLLHIEDIYKDHVIIRGKPDR
jgi:DNA-binding LytR/AlgR family response regulator